ncbi:MAG: o-succinylbenzoate synthase [Tannerella sp.]|jgi:o-succinylbenzoate synthase|nr:o-succinylbenzoate synthase [Tannerella sp.]
MPFKTKITPYTLIFKRPAGTSRGTYRERKIWILEIFDKNNPEHIGRGECAPLPDLSCDYSAEYEKVLTEFCAEFEKTGKIDFERWRNYSSLLFGFETAILHYESNSYKLWDTPFTCGAKGIDINGLIWMGDYEDMFQQVENKINTGFNCIKIKIGAIGFEDELRLLRYIRTNFTDKDLIIRLDANGSFPAAEALDKLKRLSDFDIHSIEQPIQAGHWDEMAKLCDTSPIPVALDEDLIGINDFSTKKELMKVIHPQYIIIKPSLHGGIFGGNEWIQIAESEHVGWWITSALESNIGLNCISQWCATFDNPLHQGLGTGALYHNNFEFPLHIENGKLWCNFL